METMLWRLTGSVALFAVDDQKPTGDVTSLLPSLASDPCYFRAFLLSLDSSPAAEQARRQEMLGGGEEERSRRHHRRRLRGGFQRQPRGRRSDDQGRREHEHEDSESRSVRSAASWATNRRTTPPRNRPIRKRPPTFLRTPQEPHSHALVREFVVWPSRGADGSSSLALAHPSAGRRGRAGRVVLPRRYLGKKAAHARSRLEDRRDPVQLVGQRRRLVAGTADEAGRRPQRRRDPGLRGRSEQERSERPAGRHGQAHRRHQAPRESRRNQGSRHPQVRQRADRDHRPEWARPRWIISSGSSAASAICNSASWRTCATTRT